MKAAGGKAISIRVWPSPASMAAEREAGNSPTDTWSTVTLAPFSMPQSTAQPSNHSS